MDQDLDMMAVMGIRAFGAKKTRPELDAGRFDKSRRADPVPAAAPEPVDDQLGPSTSGARHVAKQPPHIDSDSDEGSSESDDDDGEQERFSAEAARNGSAMADQEDASPQFPITHELVLSDHNKVLSAIALDPSGARVLSGSHDYECKLWDFGGMDSRAKPFKSWEPSGSYYINDLKYSNKGDKFLVISGTSQAKLYERDGAEICTFIKGDPYIRDMKNTSGHVADIWSCMWHPTDPQIFITGSSDSTIRIWDVEDKRKQKTVIVVKSKERGARTRVTACSYSPDGKVIAAACLDGALHLWNTSSNFVRPNMTVEAAHQKNTEVGSVVFSLDGRTMLTRGGDNTVKLWDMRNFRRPIQERNELTFLYSGTNAIFSPDEKYILTGCGVSSKGQTGRLLFLDRQNLQTMESVELDSTVVKVVWHPRINQIVAGTASGKICVLYSPRTSTNGAKLVANKGQPKKATIESMSQALLAPQIIAPHALPMFKDGDDVIATLGSMKRKRDRERTDPRKARRPELPVVGPGKGGRVGASATQHIVQNLFRDTTRDIDPREALLKYADQDGGELMWTAAWKNSGQVFAATEEEKEGEEGE